MKLIYIDESGFLHNWTKNIEEAPYHVVSAFSIDAANYYSSTQDLISELSTLGFDISIGKEIKAKKAFSQSMYCLERDCGCEYDTLIEKILSFPSEHDGVAWSIVFDKNKWLKSDFNQHIEPQLICLNDLFERIQLYLRKSDDFAICFIDQNKRFDDKVYNLHKKINVTGSFFPAGSSTSDSPYKFVMDRIIELHLGNSCNCVGLKIADFIARGTYQYLKERHRKNHKKIWWKSCLINSFDKNEGGKVIGYGYKKIPR